MGKALQSGDVAAAQSAVSSLKNAAPTQNGRADFQNAVKAPDQAAKSGDLKSARESFQGLRQNGPQRASQANQESQGTAPTVQQQRTRPVAPTQSQQVERTEQSGSDRNTNAPAFITRQDLSANSAQARPGTLTGKNIDTTA